MDDAPPPQQEAPHSQPPPPPHGSAPERGFFNDLLDKLHLGDLDAGDLLLLLFLLFYLSRQKADEELLIAIGLLLIL